MIIENPDIVSRLLRVLGHEDMRRIMVSIMDRAKSVAQISEESGIPLRTCYDYILKMKDGGLIVVERSVITDNGKLSDLYRCTYSELRVHCGAGKMEVHVSPHEGVADRFYRFLSVRRK